jgi:triosephosphate isomerase
MGSEAPAAATEEKKGAEAATLGRKFFVGGNWKCNGTRDSIKKLIEELNKSVTPEEYLDKRKKKHVIPARINKDHCEIVVAPPFVYIPQVVATIKPAYQVAGQNCWINKGGAITGETSADQLLDVGCRWVILGHSERRTILGESDAMVAIKAAYALSLGLGVMACIGESIHERETGNTNEVCFAQMQAFLSEVKEPKLWAKVVVAYEPVWAIGSGKTATPEQAQAVHAAVRAWMSENINPAVAAATRIIYGGSANAANGKALAKMPDIDGFLVGGAALKGEDFTMICMASMAKHEQEEDSELEAEEENEGEQVD